MIGQQKVGGVSDVSMICLCMHGEINFNGYFSVWYCSDYCYYNVPHIKAPLHMAHMKQ